MSPYSEVAVCPSGNRVMQQQSYSTLSLVSTGMSDHLVGSLGFSGAFNTNWVISRLE